MQLSLRIVEQPARYHRFRYETEIAGGKLGGLLYGRSGSGSCVKLALTGFDPSKCRSLVVIGGTISPDGYPHPFYMHGDLCDSGAFQWRRDLTAKDAGKAELEISLEKVSLVCVPHGGSSGKLQNAIKRREEIQFNPYNKKMSEMKYTSRNVRELRLVFQAFYVDLNGKTVASKGAIVQTDVISDIKFQTKLEIDDINPEFGYIGTKEQEVWISFKDALTHTEAFQYKAFLDFEGTEIVRCSITWVKKQLMALSIPSVSSSAVLPAEIERFNCTLRIVDLKSDVTAEHEFILSRVCAMCGQCGQGGDANLQDFPTKRTRMSNSNGNQTHSPTPSKLIRLPANEDSNQSDASNSGNV